MSTTTTPVRTLDDIAGDDGIFAIIAMDQRNTLRRMFTAVGIDATDADLRQSKADVARVLSPAASGILFDPTYGVPAVTATGALHPDCGLLVASEPPERGVFNGEPRTHRDPDLDARWVLDQGGDANKFFAQLRADRPAPAAGEPDLVADCLEAVRQVVDDCREVGVPVRDREPGLPAARRGPDGQAARGRDHRGRPGAQRARHRPAEAGVPGIAGGLPAARVGARPSLGGAVRRRAVRRLHRGARGGLRRGRGLRLHRRPLGVAGVPRPAGPARQEFLETVARPRLDAVRQVAAERARPWSAAADDGGVTAPSSEGRCARRHLPRVAPLEPAAASSRRARVPDLVVGSGRAGASQDERHGKDDLPLEAALGPVDPLEEPGGGDLTDPRRILVDHGQRRPQ